MGLKVTGTRQLFTAPKGEKGDKGDDGRSVTLKGRIYAHTSTIPSSYDKVDAPLYAVDSPFCLYYWNESIEEYVQTTPGVGDGYVVDNPDETDNGKLYSSDGSHWLGPYDFKGDPGEKGDDGDDGQDASLYRLQLTEAWARWEPDSGEWILRCCIKGNAWFIKGDSQVSATSGLNYGNQRIRIRYNNNKQLHYNDIAGDGSWSDGTDGLYMEYDEYGSSGVGTPESIIVELIGKDISDSTTVLDSQTIAIVWDGEPGQKGGIGDPGPMGIPAGTYSDSARYTRTKTICPIVEHNRQYWYPKNVGVISGVEPSSDANSPWGLVPEFDVVFVRILFATFAKLGEAIFHGNFMFSQNGIVNGASSSDYQKFKPAYPDDEENSQRFAPNLYLNFLTGAARLAAGKAKFFADGRGSLAGGNLTWDANGNVTARGTIFATGGEFGGYIKTTFKEVSESDATLIGSEDGWPPKPIYQLNTDFNLECHGAIIQLPITTSLVGTRASFFGGVGTRMDPWTINLRCQNGIYGYPTEGENTGNSDIPTSITAAGGLIELLCVKIRNNQVIWCITSINVQYKYTNLDIE